MGVLKTRFAGVFTSLMLAFMVVLVLVSNLSANTLAADSTVYANEVNGLYQISGTVTPTSQITLTAVASDTLMYFPLIFKPVPTPELLAIPRPNSGNQWTVSWNAVDGTDVTYELEEDSNDDFSSPGFYLNGANLSRAFSHSASIDNYYCYRVRAAIGGQRGDWSNVECVAGAYYDDMSSSASGWAIRQEDTDDANNESYYKNGNLVLKIHGRWDFAVASPLRSAPEPPYEISARIRTNKPDNLNSYGLIFGGDWNGTTCPNSNFNSCFNHYYRLNIIWYGSKSSLSVRLKRIDYHDDKEGNAGRGVGLTDYFNVKVGNPPEQYVEWRVQVLEDGTINIYANNNLVKSVTDSTYINGPYFGVFAATDEYLGSEPWVDWYRVTPLD